MVPLSHHPLMFAFRDTVSGEGFLAGVTLSGRALMMQEDEQWWMYGVRPAGIAEHGATPQETFHRFRDRYTAVLFDIAAEHRTYEDFRQEVERFFYEPDKEEELRWEKALEDVRSCAHEPPEPFAALPRQKPETRPAQITVERLDGEAKRFMPSDNVVASYFVPDRDKAA